MASTAAEFAGPDLVHLVVGVPQQARMRWSSETATLVAIASMVSGSRQWPTMRSIAPIMARDSGRRSHSVEVQELADVVGVNGLGDVAAPSGLVTVIDPVVAPEGTDVVIRFGAAVVTVAAVPWKATVFWRRGGTTDQPLARRARFWRGTPRWPAGSDAGRISLTSPVHRP